MLQNKLLLITLFICFSTLLSAKHILSGSMTYECLGNDEYEFTMIIYRDCFGGGAGFDNYAAITAYVPTGSTQVYEEFMTIEVQPEVVEQIDPIDCDGDATQYCSEKAIYKFNMMLPIGNGPYTVAYQRCCWSEAVSNLLNPGEHGITIFSVVSELALETCNSQPAIDMPLSFSACPGTEMTIPILPFDADGDSLAYEICMPFEGGGLDGTINNPGDPNSCTGVTPYPACPPPYLPLQFASGFDINNPFPTTDGVTVDEVNGTISFTPTTQGIFIYGLCITEYRDGQILSSSTHNIETTSRLENPNSQFEINDFSWTMTQSRIADLLLFYNASKENGAVTIYDLSGKILLTKIVDQLDTFEINTSDLESGIYFINIVDGQATKTFQTAIVR